MRYPTLPAPNTSRQMTDVFKGYNHNLRIGEGEFYDMMNLTSDSFPVLTPRGKRGTFPDAQNVSGLIAKDALCYVDGSKFVMNEYRVEMHLTPGSKNLISMGAYVIIMPDKKYINTADLTDFGNIEALFTTRDGVDIELCTMAGEAISVAFVQANEPEGAANMDMWIDTSSTPNSLKQYNESTGMWVSVATTYVKISSPNLGAAFEKFDGVVISGLAGTQLIDKTSGQPVTDDSVSALDGSFVIWDKGQDYIVVVGIVEAVRHLSNNIMVERTMPNMDYIVESENRLWGCRYGTAIDGTVVNEIYACKLGDFKNWNCFMGISTDSYVASCGTDGVFTGAITHLGHPCFFKEGFLHKIYGNYPANFQIQTTACRGVQKGSSKSLAIVNEVLYYKSALGVCAYDGSLPGEISAALGQLRYQNAVGGALQNKYYISMEDEIGGYHQFVYDTAKNMWYREEETEASEFCTCRGDLYYISKADGMVHTMLGSHTTDIRPVQWMAETGILSTDMPDRKYIARLNVRMALDVGSAVEFYIEYDSCGTFVPVFNMTGTNLMSFSIPIRPRRCDHMRLRISGTGPAKIFSITKTIEQGSDLR